MGQVLHHRGPDESGSFISDDVALGHQRLSIVDLESGQQPMYNKEKNVYVIFNGEIYNHRELRSIIGEKNFITNNSSRISYWFCVYSEIFRASNDTTHQKHSFRS